MQFISPRSPERGKRKKRIKGEWRSEQKMKRRTREEEGQEREGSIILRKELKFLLPTSQQKDSNTFCIWIHIFNECTWGTSLS